MVKSLPGARLSTLTGTATPGQSWGWMQLVALPLQQPYTRACFCGKATTFYLLMLPIVFAKEVKNNNVRSYFLPNHRSAAVLLHHQLHAHTQLCKSSSRDCTNQPRASGLEMPGLRSTSPEVNGYTDGKHRYGKQNNGEKIKNPGAKSSTSSLILRTLLTNEASFSG